MQYIGVDQHKKFSYIVVMDEKGRIVKEGKVVNDREELKKVFKGLEGRESQSSNRSRSELECDV